MFMMYDWNILIITLHAGNAKKLLNLLWNQFSQSFTIYSYTESSANIIQRSAKTFHFFHLSSKLSPWEQLFSPFMCVLSSIRKHARYQFISTKNIGVPADILFLNWPRLLLLIEITQPANAAAPSTAAPAGEGMVTTDQGFLLNIILGKFFGPHLKGETATPQVGNAQNSREIATGPQYTPNQLDGYCGPNHARIWIHAREGQSICHSGPSLFLKFIRNMLQAKVLRTSSKYPRCIDLFPIDLHICLFVEEQIIISIHCILC